MSEQAVERLGGTGGTRVSPGGRRRFWDGFAVLALLGVLAGIGGAWYSFSTRRQRLDRDLVVALDNWDVTAMEELVRDGASVKKSGLPGVTCTVLAATRRSPDLLREMLDRGAPVDAVQPLAPSALRQAAGAGWTPHLQLLIERGATVDAADGDGKTALMYATAAYGSPEALRTLLKAGANLDLADHQGQTALMWAVSWNDPAYVKLLRDAGADLTFRDDEGRTALDRARLEAQRLARRAAAEPRMRGYLARARRIVAVLEEHSRR